LRSPTHSPPPPIPAPHHYNRIKIVLKKKKRTGKWLAQQLGKDEGTVSRWCRNIQQPNIETLFQVADLLDVDVNELLESNRG
jgi:putative transcriptional regulator